MNESPSSVVLEGTGRPDIKVVKSVKKGISRWAERTFTLSGREEVAREKLTKKFATVTQSLSESERQSALLHFENTLDQRAHDQAIVSIVRDTAISGITLLAGVALWNFRGTIEFFTRGIATMRLEQQNAIRAVDKNLPAPMYSHQVDQARVAARKLARTKLEQIMHTAKENLREKGVKQTNLAFAERVAREASRILRAVQAPNNV